LDARKKGKVIPREEHGYTWGTCPPYPYLYARHTCTCVTGPGIAWVLYPMCRVCNRDPRNRTGQRVNVVSHEDGHVAVVAEGGGTETFVIERG